MSNSSGRRGQMSRSVSLGASDPRARRGPQEALTDLDLKLPLKLTKDGQISIDLAGALTVNPDGTISINTSNGITTAPGSPLSIQLNIDDDSLEITNDKKVRARPRFSQIKVDQRDVREVTGRNLAEVIDNETELIKRRGAADGYASLDSTGKVPAAQLPVTAIPATISILAINDITYGEEVVRFENTSGAAVNGLSLANSDTGSAVTIASVGSDTNVDINVAPQGSGKLRVNSSIVETQNNKGAAGGYADLDANGYLPIQYATTKSLEHYQQDTAANPDQCYLANSRTGVTLTTTALNTDRLYWIPFIAPARGATLADLRIQVTTISSGNNVAVGIYNCVSSLSGPDTSDYRPYGSALSSVTQSVGATGSFTLAVTTALTGGRLYWIAVHSQAAPQLRGVTSNQCDLTLGWVLPSGTTIPSAITHWYQSRSYASGLPTSLAGTETYTNGTGAFPAVFYTLST